MRAVRVAGVVAALIGVALSLSVPGRTTASWSTDMGFRTDVTVVGTPATPPQE